LPANRRTVKDVGQVHDVWAVQQNIVRENGRRSVLLSVIKNGNASTVAVVNGVRKALKIAPAAAPPGLTINELFDHRNWSPTPSCACPSSRIASSPAR